MRNVEALKELYEKLGGDPKLVENANSITEVLNLISAHFDGAADAMSNAAAILNIADADELVLPKYDGAVSGDVSSDGGLFTEGVLITYKNQEIARITETGELSLLTANSNVERNIGVAYRKPEPKTVTIPIYYKIGNDDEVIFDTINLQPGTLYSETKDIFCGGVNVVNWEGAGGLTPYPPIGCACKASYNSSNHKVAMSIYTPSAIPTGYTRIVIHLTAA